MCTCYISHPFPYLRGGPRVPSFPFRRAGSPHLMGNSSRLKDKPETISHQALGCWMPPLRAGLKGALFSFFVHSVCSCLPGLYVMAHVRYLFVYKTRLFMMAHVPCPRRFRLLVESGSCRRLRCTGRGRAFSANGGTGSCTRAGAYHIRTACAPGFGCRGTSPSVRT